jgi:hypothetical protein
MSRKVDEFAAATHMGVSVSFLRNGRCRGVLGNSTPPPPHLKLGSRVLYDLADLDRWLDERKVQPGKGKAAPGRLRQGVAA